MKRISKVISPVVGTLHYRTLQEAISTAKRISRENPKTFAKAVTETKTPYGPIFRSGDREWFPGSVEELRTAKAWEENQKNKWCFTCDRPQADCACVENGGYGPPGR